ncbi:MAG: NAD(P)H-dependent oxidoreductase subunit E [Calditrichia bacterium]
MSLYKHHVFVCVNEREASDARGSCSQKGSRKFWERFKKEIKDRKLQSRIRINQAGCLGTCNQGTSVVIYPAGIWYGKVSEEDIPDIIEKTLLNNEIIDHLLMPFARKKIRSESGS